MYETQFDLRIPRRAFSRIGFGLSAILVAATVVQLVALLIAELIGGPDNWLVTSSWGIWLLSAVPMYAVAIPLGLLIFRGVPSYEVEKHKLPAKAFLVIVPVCFFMMIGGSLIGTVLSLVLSGGTAENQVAEIVMDNNPLKVVVVVILAPIMEELVCRKQLIDRTVVFGEKTAVVISALAFGLLHQNLYQFFYAFGVGLVFGYVYLRTGLLRYTVILHAILNFLGSVVAPWIVSMMDADVLAAMETSVSDAEMLELMAQVLPGTLLLMLYSLLEYGLAIAGLVLLIVNRKKLLWRWTVGQLPPGTAGKTTLWNVGMVVYMVLCAAMMVLALF